MKRIKIPIHGFFLATTLLLYSCDQQEPKELPKDHDPTRVRYSDEDHIGLITYQNYCVGCHGEKGDGKGPAARFLNPKPRDFTKGVFKFISVIDGGLPTDEDLIRVIDKGLHGTAMPHFKLLSQAEKEGVVETIKSFSTRWTEEPPGTSISFYSLPIELGPDAQEDIDLMVEEGEQIYHSKAQCWSCHPVYASGDRLKELEEIAKIKITRDNPTQSITPEANDWGEIVIPPEFRTDHLKSARDLNGIYRVLASGIGGTQMPSWDGSLTGDELWALTFYIDSLVQEGKKAREAVRVSSLSPPKKETETAENEKAEGSSQ